MALRRRETLDIALAVVKGEAEPADPFPLDKERAITIGRTGSIRLLDQLVSIHHARVIFDSNKEHFLIEDLGSATGTFVNGECVRGERRELKLGTELRLGETTLRVERIARLTWVLPLVGIVAGGLVTIAFVLVTTFLLRNPVGNAPLEWDNGVLTPEGRMTSIVIPDVFRWERGLLLPLKIRSVSDFDYNGRDEMWIVDGSGKTEFVVTFGEDGSWKDLGMFPAGCSRRGNGTSFPPVDCPGEQWQMDPVDEKYQPVFQEGAVVWYRAVEGRPPPLTEKERKEKEKEAKKRKEKGEPEPVAAPVFGALPKDAQLEVGRFAIKDKDKLAQFLGERGIYEPIHYLVCEGTFEGIRAQVLTYRGVVQDLGVGCIEELLMEGQISARPYAAAFTPAGLRALTGDVMTFYAGDPTGLFLDAGWASMEKALKADPGYYIGSARLLATTKNAALQTFDPIPPLETRIEGSHRLIETDRMLVPAATATTVTLPGPGTTTVQTSSCETFEIETSSFGSPGWFSSKTLVEVREIGCGASTAVMSALYEQGRTRMRVGAREIAVDVELEKPLIGGVARVRFSWR